MSCKTAVIICVHSLPEVWLRYPATDAEPRGVSFSYCFGGEEEGWEAAGCGTSHISLCAGSHRRVEFL